jgi:hypothetical protein
VLLVPRMVYMPFVAAAPTGPVRMTPNMTVVPPPYGAPPPQEKPPYSGPGPEQPAPCPKEECTQQLLDMCKKLNQRLDCIEKNLKDRAEPVCPAPLLRRPLFNRPLFNRCETPCEIMIPCEPGPVLPGPTPKGAAIEMVPPGKTIPVNPGEIEAIAPPARKLSNGPTIGN